MNYEKVCSELTIANIQYGHHYKFPLHQEKLFCDYNSHNCPNAENLASKILSLPTHTHLSNEQVDYIIQTVISAL